MWALASGRCKPPPTPHGCPRSALHGAQAQPRLTFTKPPLTSVPLPSTRVVRTKPFSGRKDPVARQQQRGRAVGCRGVQLPLLAPQALCR